MGLIIDSSIFIAAERNGDDAGSLIAQLHIRFSHDLALSSITVAELAHGVARANTPHRLRLREVFLEELLGVLDVHPVTSGIARDAGVLDGKLAAEGFSPGLPDLLIGMTAIEAGYGVLTANVRHFRMIPGLRVIQP